ncbi:MAG: hypothetical protein Q8S00_19360 [Deltaproteobacteria bacterium]|nr:hypothetical protein [Deltaproteobacteria bacterium]MDZ4347827.1 hypothetical protein [Candidatus Binatia bacterium]
MDIKTVFEIGVLVITLIAALYGGLLFIDKRIENRIRDDAFLRKLASALRPSVVFDHKGPVLIDQGAMRFIEAIDVELDKEGPYPKRIIIHPTQHLSYAPLLTPLESDLADISTSRGNKHDWIYTIDYFMTSEERRMLRYRLEIIL